VFFNAPSTESETVLKTLSYRKIKIRVPLFLSEDYFVMKCKYALIADALRSLWCTGIRIQQFLALSVDHW